MPSKGTDETLALELLSQTAGKQDAVSAVTHDANDELSSIGYAIHILLDPVGPYSADDVNFIKTMVEMAYYRGYIAGQAQGSLSTWQTAFGGEE